VHPMRTLRTTVPAVLLWLAAAVWCGEPPAKTDAPAPEQLAAWVRQLGDENFQTREEAQQKLLAAGQPAVAPLRTAAQSEDAEVRTRAERILGELEAGDRIRAAMQKLGAGNWDEVKSALDVLVDQVGRKHGVEEAVRAAARGSGQAAALARKLEAYLKQRQDLETETQRLNELAKTNPNVLRVVQLKLGPVAETYKQQLYKASEEEFQKQKAGQEKPGETPARKAE